MELQYKKFDHEADLVEWFNEHDSLELISVAARGEDDLIAFYREKRQGLF